MWQITGIYTLQVSTLIKDIYHQPMESCVVTGRGNYVQNGDGFDGLGQR